MYGLIDCDNFFCSCERVFRPDLARTPIVVLSNNDGCVVARSREVKAMGIREGLPYYQMRRQYRDAGIIAFSSNYELYGDMSARVMAILREEVAEVLQYSIDEAFLNLDGMNGADIHAWGTALCRHVERCTGIPVSLGIAQTKTLAKVASKFAKRYPAYNKCCVIGNEHQRETALRLFPVGDVWGVGRKITRGLEKYGVATAYDFIRCPRGWIRSNFHITCERIWQELNGENAIDIDGLDTVDKKTIVTSRSFPGMITEIDHLTPHIANYAARCAMKLRRQHSVCSMVTVFLQSNHFRDDLPQYDNSGSTVFTTATNTSSEIVEAALATLTGIYRQGISYKRAGVMVSGISSASAIQPDLFVYSRERRDRLNAMSDTMDRINGRMGADTVILASQQYSEKAPDGRNVTFANAIRHTLKSPEYHVRLGSAAKCHAEIEIIRSGLRPLRSYTAV